MIVDIVVRYLHFLSILLVVSTVLGEHLLVRRVLTRGQLERLARVDAVYGIGAVLVLLTGFAQWFWVGKPPGFYSPNPLFHAKVTLFLVVGLVSIYPTVFFVKQRKGEPSEEVAVPPGVIWSLRAELLLLVLIPLLAVLVGRGVGIPVVE